MRFTWLALALLLAQLALACLGVDAQAASPRLIFMAIQVCALLAIGQRYQFDPSPIAPIWLLLGAAAGLQLVWAAINMLATLTGDEGGFLSNFAVVFSGLYMIPCMFLIARSFDRSEPATVVLADLAMSLIVAVLLCTLIFSVMPGGPAATPGSIMLIIDHADAIDFSLAAMAGLRMLGTRSLHKRFFYYAATVFLGINAIAAAIYNRLELHGLPPWTVLMIGLAYVALITVLERPVPRLLRRYRPARRMAQTVTSFAPVVLSLGVLLLAVSVSRFNYSLGMTAAGASVVLYALRVAFIQSRNQDIQRAAHLSNQRLQQQVGRDPLTGIANRAMLIPRLQVVCAHDVPRGTVCSLLMIDIDHFKLFNDHHGHLAGDTCLTRVSQVLAHHPLPPDSLVARFGGEEFAIVLPHTPPEAARIVAERLLDAVERLRIPHADSATGWLTVSIGTATQRCDGSADPMHLIEAADRALYQAKGAGRNRCEAAANIPHAPSLDVS
ncbi:diguanylate cyclase (GGDEF) domain-containing protein [Dyella sp. OK004]|uniref:GGDEF domain-containing protein n=1 Tax=Dyella sp. OK004 TaxID=1855292 RepID=UPI0008E9218F|nr:GGDEF domain-containing protein [Dyella sp. OK004]SFS19673.1 diguanylate cyclase (GGDEF) domain-containing protein [Dyella sp. OK004]